MRSPPILAFGVLSALAALSEGTDCVQPGTCEPPPAKFANVIRGPAPGQQWNFNGGFCGAWSVQQCTLAFGAYVSQDLIRKANKDSPGPHAMHGDSTVGFEVMPINVAFTAKNLKISYDEWDYTKPSPQAKAYKAWLKSHLVQGEPVVFFPMCKGDGHMCYRDSPTDEGACPNGGTCDHVEPMFGIFTNSTLDDLTVYDDDVILHASDQDYMPYYRRMDSLQDSTKMDGNCAIAQPGFGRNEMYPCIDVDVTYGLAVTGLQANTDDGNITASKLPKVSMTIDITYEPNVRIFEKPCEVHANISVDTSGLDEGEKCVLFRYNSTEIFPVSAPYDAGYEYATPFTADGSGAPWTYADPNSFFSNTAVYYRAVC